MPLTTPLVRAPFAGASFSRVEFLDSWQETFAARPVMSVWLGEAANGFGLLDAVGLNGSTYVKAKATLAGTEALGVVINKDGPDRFELSLGGVWHMKGHGKTVGKHYLSSSVDGGTTTTAPGPGTKVQVVLFVLDANTILINPMGEARP